MDEANIIIKPLVQQHARDAAFYWQQINESDFSSIVSFEKLSHLEKQRNAHLDGLIFAGQVGREEALKELKRWKTQGEAFTCGFLAYQTDDISYLSNVQNLIYQAPATTLEGYISALSLLPFEVIKTDLNTYLQSIESSNVCVALGGFSHHKYLNPDEQIQAFLHHEDYQVQAAACRYVNGLRLTHLLPDLHHLNQQNNLLVKHASAIALGWLDIDSTSIKVILQNSIESYINAVPPKGLAGLLHHKRLEELVRLAGQVYSAQKSDCSTVLELLPSYLKIIFLGHYGRTDYLSYLLEVLDDDELGRLSFWAIHMLTGLDLDDATLLLPAQPNTLAEKPIMKRSMQLGIGIRKPRAESVYDACQTIVASNEPILLGKKITEQRCTVILSQGRQVERNVASWHLARLNPQLERTNIRIMRG